MIRLNHGADAGLTWQLRIVISLIENLGEAMATAPQRAPTERIGVIFVHGIGEQGAFEHLETGATELIQALRSKERGKRITASVNTTADAMYKAGQQTWRAEDSAPVSIDVLDNNNQTFKRIELREVWWADLDEPAGLRSLARFLWWGCTLWARPAYREPKAEILPSFGKKLFTPREKGDPTPEFHETDTPRALPSGLDRMQLFFVAVLFVLVIPTWYLLGVALRLLRLPTIPSAGLLIEYIGDVKLYGQQSRTDTWPLTDLGTPPRFMIRRRFVRAMIDTALGGYDRWYVFGHSLGSVVALNGLMEPGHSIPNYLDEERWAKCGLGKITRMLTGEGITPVASMIPARPAWLHDGDAIDRTKLFAEFRGLLTYGSPLDKFAVLFPATVPLNREQTVFPPAAEWINLYESTDPVAGPLDLFGPFDDSPRMSGGFRALSPENYSVSCWPVAMWSHIKYFARPATSILADAVQKWLIHGGRFESAFSRAGGKPLSSAADAARRISKWVQIIVFFVITLFAFVFLLRFIEPWAKIAGVWDKVRGIWTSARASVQSYLFARSPALPDWAWDAAWILASTAGLILVLGIVGRIVIKADLKRPK